MDEVINGHATTVGVTLHKDGRTVTVTDNGRGIPVDIHPQHGKSASERFSRPSMRAESSIRTTTSPPVASTALAPLW